MKISSRGQGPLLLMVRGMALVAVLSVVLFGSAWSGSDYPRGVAIAQAVVVGPLAVVGVRALRTRVERAGGTITVYNPLRTYKVEVAEVDGVRMASGWAGVPLVRITSGFRSIDVWAFSSLVDDPALVRQFQSMFTDG